jgi:hypothetical protein
VANPKGRCDTGYCDVDAGGDERCVNMGSPLAVRVNVSAKSGRCGYGQVSAWRCFDEGKNKTPA